MTRRRRYVLVGAIIASTAVAAPVLAQLASDDDDGLVVGRWQNAVVQFADDGKTATVVVVYDAGERDLARRLEIEQDPRPGVGITLALMLGKADGDGYLNPVSDIRCVKARVRGLRRPEGAGVPVLDRYDTELEGEGTPHAGFVLPPLSECRTVEADVVSGE